MLVHVQSPAAVSTQKQKQNIECTSKIHCHSKQTSQTWLAWRMNTWPLTGRVAYSTQLW